MRSLDGFGAGARLRVVSVRGRGAVRRRILDMGLVPGVLLEIERVAPLGDPVTVRLRGYYLSLRREETRSIIVEPV
ncbi:iron transporter [Thermosulfuriphilus ammonigenes]|uniref:Iron transporter n=1 Tax=Thermosulfuriphilus ammonigenes TaxID=1936021 RepID=A0A6G7PXS0_9BACT|nr:FeoA family protein [Thermosulfuriphilus ammonigenes]MBA2849704.1 ferrous iron transport protein A [Thermosulfuriphilus ammonigenes]QIJ72203.1 iron transporter [Thermosulfuriphilus ammonigenes]